MRSEEASIERGCTRAQEEKTHMIECPVLCDVLNNSERDIRPQGLVHRTNDSLPLLWRPCRHDHREAVAGGTRVSKPQSCPELRWCCRMAEGLCLATVSISRRTHERGACRGRERR